MYPLKRLAIRFLSRRRNMRRAATTFQLACRSLGLGGNPSIYESGEVHFLRHYLRSIGTRPVVFDVGANRGEYALAALGLRRDARVFAFEPNPELAATLERIDSLKVIRAACGSAKGDALLYTDANSAGSGFATLQPATLALRPVSHIARHKVRTLRLDDFIEEHGIESVSLLKIDAEGHEVEVLRGAVKTIERHVVQCIQFEFNAGHAVERIFLRDFHEMLPHYRMFRLAPDALIDLGPYRPEVWETYLQQNIVALLPHAAAALAPITVSSVVRF
jgi:FkbM family methyltransferase